jgi:hypothetical protein
MCFGNDLIDARVSEIFDHVFRDTQINCGRAALQRASILLILDFEQRNSNLQSHLGKQKLDMAVFSILINQLLSHSH